METVSDDLVLRILAFVPAMDLLCATCMTSNRFARAISSDLLWLHRFSTSLSDSIILTKRQRQRYCVYLEWVSLNQNQNQSNISDIATAPPACLRFGSVLPSRLDAFNFVRIGRICAGASSTDHPHERLEQVLLDTDESITDFEGESPEIPESNHRQRRWWSSQGYDNADSNDLLLLATRYPLTMISSIAIKPLKDPYSLGGVVYTWKQTRVAFYNLPLELIRRNPESQTDEPCSFIIEHGHMMIPASSRAVESLLDGHEPVFTSEAFQVPARSSDILKYEFPAGVVANVIKIVLVGKNVEQFAGSGYFACIERLDIHGIPLL